METTKKTEVNFIQLPNTEESIIRGSLEQSESPVSKRRIFTDFPTEETLNLRSLNSPHTASSIRETFFDKIKDVVMGSKVGETLRLTQTVSDSKDDPPVVSENRVIEAFEPHEMMIGQEVPTLIWCAFCKGERKTELDYVNSSKTFWASVGIFLAGGVAGCCLAPYCINKCKATRLTCSRCGHIVMSD
jgi:hypothetical protein